MEDTALTPIEELRKLAKQRPSEQVNVETETVKNNNVKDESDADLNAKMVKDGITDVYKEKFAELKKDEKFKNTANAIVVKGAETSMKADLLKILSDEQRNQLAQYQLECEKEQLEYRKKHEKKVIKEEVKAEIQEKKIIALKKRFGYLYKKDENGEPINFTTSKFVNRWKEFGNWYDSTSDTFKKIVKGTLKIMLWCAIIFAVYKGFVWVFKNIDLVTLIKQ